jgi:hypothetical protein
VSRVRITVEVDHHYPFLLSLLFLSDRQTIVEQISLLVLSYPNHLRSKIGIDVRECFSAVPGFWLINPPYILDTEVGWVVYESRFKLIFEFAYFEMACSKGLGVPQGGQILCLHRKPLCPFALTSFRACLLRFL